MTKLKAWFIAHRLPVCLFGGLMGALLAVAAIAAIWGPEGFAKHVLQRNLELHLMAGAGLYLLFSRFVLFAERKRKRAFGWFLWYLAPVFSVMAISFTQEYGFSLMGESRGTLGGDWAYNAESVVARLKSFADSATWLAYRNFSKF